MKSNKLFTMAVVGAFLTVGAHLAVSQTQEQEEWTGFRPGMHARQAFPGGPAGGFMHFRMLRRLNLTEEQMALVKAFQQDQFEKTKEERMAFMDARDAYQKAVEALENVNGDNEQYLLIEASEELAKTQAAFAIASAGQRTEFLNYLDSTLDDEQRSEFIKLRAEMEQFRNGRFERRKERRQDLR